MHRRGQARIVLVAVVGLVALGACAKKSTTASTPPAAVGATYTVDVDANRADLGLPATGTVFAFTPKTLSVHPGDTVHWQLNDSGEPHTVAIGAIPTAAANAVDNAGPHGDSSKDPAVLALPQLLPKGPGDAIQAAANPCVVVSGTVPTKGSCPVHTEEAFSGTEQIVSSGWLTADAGWTLKISPTATPGAIRWLCQLHNNMTATLNIVPKATVIPTPDDVAAATTTTLQGYATQLKALMAVVAATPGSKATAGLFSRTFQGGQVDAFGPADIKIPVGGKVTWNVFGPHSIYFNAPTDALGDRLAAPDGTVHLNAKADMPVGGGGPFGKPGPFDAGTWDGTGPHSSGIILSFPPDLISYSLTFTKAGTYNYQCSIHLKMKGTVTVG